MNKINKVLCIAAILVSFSALGQGAAFREYDKLDKSVYTAIYNYRQAEDSTTHQGAGESLVQLEHRYHKRGEVSFARNSNFLDLE